MRRGREVAVRDSYPVTDDRRTTTTTVPRA
jgi:hypothetical protein